jgi:benzoyl-CoA reductase/2-hydroxyglutaryl-CoA dehydratase subunit BcrC/BadD/HgdB
MDHPQLNQIVDQMGAIVVGDYHFFGNHFLIGQVDIEQSALKAISEHYHHCTLSSRSFKPNPQQLIDFCLQQHADGIVFYFLQGEEALTWQVPDQLKCAKAAGINTCVFYDQNYAVDTGKESTRLQSFIHSLTTSGQTR